MRDSFVVVGLTVVGGTVAVVGFLLFKVMTGDINCGRPFVDGYQPNMVCCYDGHCANIPIAPGATPGAARK